MMRIFIYDNIDGVVNYTFFTRCPLIILLCGSNLRFVALVTIFSKSYIYI